LLGNNILGTGFSFDITIVRGAGALYVVKKQLSSDSRSKMVNHGSVRLSRLKKVYMENQQQLIM